MIPSSGRAAAAALAEVTDYYHRILEALPAQLAVFTPDGCYEYVTPSAIGDPEVRAWVIGRDDSAYAAHRGLPPEVPARRLDAIRTVATTRVAVTFEESFITRDGTLRTFRRFVSPVLDASGTVRSVLGYGLDITEQRITEEQLRQSQKLEALGRLAGGVAHDFNNLLTVISGTSEVIEETLDANDERLEMLHVIRDAASRATELTRQLLSFSRRAPERPRVIDAHAAIHSVVQMLRRLLGEPVRIDLALDAPTATVRVDPGHLNQILINLAVNARDAMPDGGSLGITTRTTSTMLDGAAAPSLELRVTDTGHGMCPDTLARAFEPFFTTKAASEGTGLGLSTVYGIVSQSRGVIHIDSVVGQGTTVTVQLPLETAAPTDDGISVTAEPGLDRGSETILVAEDELGVRLLIARTLRRFGYTVLEAASGGEALATAAAFPGPIHALVTDLVMSDVGGHMLARQLRTQRPALRVVYMSGYAEPEEHPTVDDTDGTFLSKPFRVTELVRALQSQLAQVAP
jgi:two-component system, cell cycle sensor histidine kinase and response regulator CckA